MGKLAVVALNERVFPIRLDGLDETTIPVPLHFEPKQNELMFAQRRPTKLRYTVRGGTAPYSVTVGYFASAEGKYEQVITKSDDGSVEVEFDDKKLINHTLAALVQMSLNEFRRQDKKVDRAGQFQELDKYRESVSPSFIRVTGRDPRGFPVPKLLKLDVVDSKNAKATMEHRMFIEIPEQEVRRAIASSPK